MKERDVEITGLVGWEPGSIDGFGCKYDTWRVGWWKTCCCSMVSWMVQKAGKSDGSREEEMMRRSDSRVRTSFPSTIDRREQAEGGDEHSDWKKENHVGQHRSDIRGGLKRKGGSKATRWDSCCQLTTDRMLWDLTSERWTAGETHVRGKDQCWLKGESWDHVGSERTKRSE